MELFAVKVRASRLLSLALVLCAFLLTGCLGSSSSSDSDNGDEPGEQETPDEQNGDSGSGDGEEDENEEDSEELLTQLAREEGRRENDDRPDGMRGLARAGDQLIVNDGFTSVALVDPQTGDVNRLDIGSETSGSVEDLEQGVSRQGITTEFVHYFTTNGEDLWRSDGTEDGTYKVASAEENNIGSSGFWAFAETSQGVILQADTSNRDGDCFYRVVATGDDNRDSLVSQCGVTPERVVGTGAEIVFHNGLVHFSQEVGGGDESTATDWVVKSMDPGQIQDGMPNTDEIWSLKFEDGGEERRGPSDMVSAGGTLYISANDGDGPALHRAGARNRVFSPKEVDESARLADELTLLDGQALFFTRLWNEDREPEGFDNTSTPAFSTGSGFRAGSFPSEWGGLERQDIGDAISNSDIRDPIFGGELLFPVGPVTRPFDSTQWWRLSSAGSFSPMQSETGETINVRGNGSTGVRHAIAVQTDSALYLVGTHPNESDRQLFRFTSVTGLGEAIDISDTVRQVEALATIGDTVFILGLKEGVSTNPRHLWRLNHD